MKVRKGTFFFWACFGVQCILFTEGYAGTITASAGPGGIISPSGTVVVSEGGEQTFTITPDGGVADVLVDNSSVGAVSSYTFSNVAGHHSITASFVCNDPPVMLEYDHSHFSTILGAYDSALAGSLNSFTIMLMAGTLNAEDLSINANNASVVLKGGYGCAFQDDTMVTIIPGSLTVVAGTVTVSNLAITSAPLCAANDPNNFPGNPETCDSLDNNCNGLIDDGLATDSDGDGFTAIGSCGSHDDCNDNNAGIHPGATEIYGDGIDQNCDGVEVTPTDGVCFNCHYTDVVNMDSVHFAPEPICVACHSARVSGVLTGHYGKTVRTAGNNMAAGSVISCTSCHDTHPDAGFVIPGAGIVWGKVTSASNVTCDTCHELRAVLHATDTAHNNRVIDTMCAQCHTSDTSALGSPGSGTLTTDADVDTLHRADCKLCHVYNGTKLEAATVEQAILDGLNGSQITCLTCHAATFATIHAILEGHTALVRVGSTICGGCHSDSPPLVNAADPKVHSACTNCHDASFNTISLAAGKTFAVGGDCTTCHGNYFPAHIHHNDGAYNDVSYNPLVDTSQASQQGCADCHHDYDTVHGTSVGLSTREAIAYEHDLDGTKDGSANSCEACHAYDGSKPVPLAAVQNAIASGNPATCATCHIEKAPNVNHGIPESGRHVKHLAMAGVSCASCHNTGRIPYFRSGTDANGDGLYTLTETDVCDACHHDGNGTPATGFKDGWGDPEFVLACASCHALPPSTGAHLGHYQGTAETLVYGDLRITQDFIAAPGSTINMIGCGNCHPLDSSYHGNGVRGDVELANTAAPADSLKSRSATGSYDRTTGTCSSVYCHSANSWTTDGTVPMPWPEATGWNKLDDPLPRPLPDNIITVRNYQDVTWNSGETLTCNGCHGNSPQTSYVDNDGGAGDSHYWVDPDGYENLHVWNMGYQAIGCRTCHYGTVQEASTTVVDPITWRRNYNDVAVYDKAKHVNGSVDVLFDTVNNFTYTDQYNNPTLTVDLSVSSFAPATKTCSSVGCHLQETEVTWGVPYRWYDFGQECDRCHGYY